MGLLMDDELDDVMAMEGETRPAAEIEHLRDLQHHKGFHLLCTFIIDEIQTLTETLWSVPLAGEGAASASRLQGRILALRALLPEGGEIEYRNDYIGKMIESRQRLLKSATENSD
jgi:hypothetical protein